MVKYNGLISIYKLFKFVFFHVLLHRCQTFLNLRIKSNVHIFQPNTASLGNGNILAIEYIVLKCFTGLGIEAL